MSEYSCKYRMIEAIDLRHCIFVCFREGTTLIVIVKFSYVHNSQLLLFFVDIDVIVS